MAHPARIARSLLAHRLLYLVKKMSRSLLDSHVTTRKPRILVVDDEPAVRRGLVRVLSSGQPLWLVETAADGLEALHKMALRTPDVLLTDLSMPRMDGLLLLELASRRYPSLRRLVHSSRIGTHSPEQVGRLAHEVLVKPASAMQILSTTNRAMEQSTWAQDAPASVRYG